MRAAESDWTAELRNALLHTVNDTKGTWDAVITAAQQELRRIAHRQRLGFGSTLSTTELVHEAYLRINAAALPVTLGPRAFFAIAARLMRQILVDHARVRRAGKRGGGMTAESLSAALSEPCTEPAIDELLWVDQALDALRLQHERAADVVQLRYFAGLSDQEIGMLLEVDESTVRRDWLKARAWLHAHLGQA